PYSPAPLRFASMMPDAWHCACAERTFLSVATAADSFAFRRALSRLGIAIDAMMAMIATTIMSSMRVKPCCLLCIARCLLAKHGESHSSCVDPRHSLTVSVLPTRDLGHRAGLSSP